MRTISLRSAQLQMTGNYVDRFPDFISKCVNLRKLMLGNNFLKILPYSLGFLTNLTELQLFNNPLVDPPYETVMEGLEQTLYFCRQKYWARVNGPPPVVHIHASGIGNECLELQPEFRDRLKKMIVGAQGNNSLELQQVSESEPQKQTTTHLTYPTLSLSSTSTRFLQTHTSSLTSKIWTSRGTTFRDTSSCGWTRAWKRMRRATITSLA